MIYINNKFEKKPKMSHKSTFSDRDKMNHWDLLQTCVLAVTFLCIGARWSYVKREVTW